MKTDGRKVDPPRLTSLAFGLCFGGWFLLIDWIYYHFVLHRFPGFNHKLVLILAMFLFAGIINEIYSTNDRYLKVYDQYMSPGIIKNKRMAILFSIFFILIPYIVLAGFLIFTLNDKS
jgi:hypothetical protein